ncbi:MAG TPA: glycogen/starch/alpha-glucan phosphorylase [Candidatus Brocadiia bacterium]|nr:glycogen/starch/alpha-glucan phosphorylase [Candidatus Brocadiia bacterium]
MAKAAQGVSAKKVFDTMLRRARYDLGKRPEVLRPRDVFMALGLTARDLMVDRMFETQARTEKADAKQVYYLSMEFLMGRMLENNLLCLGILDQCREAVKRLKMDWQEVVKTEDDAALGNGGLGRLAACFLDSMAAMGLPGHGYGLNYEFGLFRQEIEDGQQKERPDNWLAHGTPWQIMMHGESCLAPVYGRVEHGVDRRGRYNPMWVDWKLLVGRPCDMLIPGYGSQAVNRLRLFAAQASQDFDMQIFNTGDYYKAMDEKVWSETVSKVLYPVDVFEAGRELRLLQEYFLVACSMRDIMRRYEAAHEGYAQFADKVAIQLNDTHPSLAIAELMRLLVDERDMPWEEAWGISQAVFGYTNHTLMQEALEKWPAPLMERVAPRHLQIIYEINRRFLDEVGRRWPGDVDRLRRMSLIEEGAVKSVRMAHLAMVGSHSVNGVAELHSRLLRENLARDFAEMWPERFNNKTNGVTPRRWMLLANPGLSALITEAIGDGWAGDLEKLRGLESVADDTGFQDRFLEVKLQNKRRVGEFVAEYTGTPLDEASLYDVQVKRMHQYKRQLLHAMFVMHEYLRLVEDGEAPLAPRTHLFGGKAAPGYWAAKLIIKLIHCIGDVVNYDRRTQGLLRVLFAPNYGVSVAERLIPAADLSEQISTAGMEASGTGNMKFGLNGALTMGTLDGANIEIRECVGEENIFIFGLTAEEVEKTRREGSYRPMEMLERHGWLRRVVEALKVGRFDGANPGQFAWLHEELTQHDYYYHLADMPSYVEAQERASRAFLDRRRWARSAILNVARLGKFSSDRTIAEYARDIWGVKRV